MRFTFLQLKAYFLSQQKGSSCHLSRQANVDQNKKACNPVYLVAIYNFGNHMESLTSNTSQNCQQAAQPAQNQHTAPSSLSLRFGGMKPVLFNRKPPAKGRINATFRHNASGSES
jgi:hypothetical protein